MWNALGPVTPRVAASQASEGWSRDCYLDVSPNKTQIEASQSMLKPSAQLTVKLLWLHWPRRCGLADNATPPCVIGSRLMIRYEKIREMPHLICAASGSTIHSSNQPQHSHCIKFTTFRLFNLIWHWFSLMTSKSMSLPYVYTVYISNCLSCKHASMPQSAAKGFQRPRCFIPVEIFLVR